MNRVVAGSFFIILGLISLTNVSWARGFSGGSMREDYFMVANGQGISSPSFWNGLSGQNPAGLALNQSLKFQAGVATFDDSTRNARGSGALLLGNGLFGAGFEYSEYNANPYPANAGEINWGVAGRFSSINSVFGISARHSWTEFPKTNASRYNLGILIDVLPGVRFGGIIPDINHGLQRLAGGFTYNFDQNIDFVIDAAYQLRSQNGVAKPGITLRTDRIVTTAAYGVRFAGEQDVILSSKFTAGIGIRFTDNVLVEYEYRGLPQHRLGLTLRLN